MGKIAKFNRELAEWFGSHGIPWLNFVEGSDFQFYYEYKNIIQWGFFEQTETMEQHFAQFFHEYGCVWTDNTFIMSLLHEVGHYMTFSNFSEKEKEEVEKQKEKIDKQRNTINRNYQYFELPTEFAASWWAIQFINNHMDWMEDLFNLCKKHFDGIFNDEKLMGQVYDYLDTVNEDGYESAFEFVDDEE